MFIFYGIWSDSANIISTGLKHTVNTKNLIRLVVILPVGDRPSSQKLLVGLDIKLCRPVGQSP